MGGVWWYRSWATIILYKADQYNGWALRGSATDRTPYCNNCMIDDPRSRFRAPGGNFSLLPVSDSGPGFPVPKVKKPPG
jgi:hypothetical protein